MLAHCLLRRAVPVILALDAALPAALWQALEGYPGGAVLAGMATNQAALSQRSLLTLEATPLSAAAQADLWRRALPALADHAQALSVRYPIWPQTLDGLRRDFAPALAAGIQPSIAQCVLALKARVDRADESFARRITPRADWDDLVLPADKLAPLREAIDRMRLQFRVLDDWGFARSVQGRRGLRMLFSGLPGTGKTLAAEVVAHALHADLLVVDLSRMVSKWIGETEKNLAAAFDQAEASAAVLFFDEADALFGKRTEVSDAHDRYANIESAYLLARLERCDSVAILATNLRQNMDKAFLRRFEVAIDFAEPAAAERLAIWRRHLPAQAPLAADVDLPQLAALFPLSGAMVRNATLGAAFIAAAEGDVITRAHIER
ncbi:MAG: ATP-binding protein, partial [Rubrivivax sp.]|nr:ATP-binding protein [Rubrivivax sp.]